MLLLRLNFLPNPPEPLEALVSYQLREYFLEVALESLKGGRAEVDFYVSAFLSAALDAVESAAILHDSWQ